MPRKSPFTEEVYLAWDQLVLDNGDRLTLAERVAGWEKLHAMCWQDGMWIVGFMDAELSGNLGMSLAMQQQRWKDAYDLSVELLAHPEILKYSRDPTLGQSYSFQIGAQLMLGEIEEAVSTGLRLLETIEPRSYYRVKLLGTLAAISQEPSLPAPLDRRIASFAQQVVNTFPGCKTLGKQVVHAKTAAELLQLINKVFEHNYQRHYGKKPG